MQGDDAVDPRCYAPIGLEPRTRALLTAVPFAGALLREGESSRRHRPFWAVTLRAADGPAAGANAELRLWPESNPEWFQGRLTLLCDADPESIAALTLDEQRGLLKRNLARRSYAGIIETAADGLADVAYLEGPRERVDVPAGLPEQPVARRVPPPLAVPVAPLPHPPFALVGRSRCADSAVPAARARRSAGRRHRDRLRAARRPARLVARRRSRAAAAGRGADRRRDRVRRRRLLRGRPRPLVRLLADGREIIAHNARYEQPG